MTRRARVYAVEEQTHAYECGALVAHPAVLRERPERGIWNRIVQTSYTVAGSGAARSLH